MKNVNVLSPDGMVRYDLQNGLHTQTTVLGMDFEKKASNIGWFVKNQFTYMGYKGDGNAIYPSGDGEIQLASTRLYGDDGLANGVGGIEEELLSAFSEASSVQYAYATTEKLISPNELDSLNGNGLTNKLTYRQFGYHLDQFVNNFNIGYESEANIVTFGTVFLDATYPKLYRNQHKYLAELADNAKKTGRFRIK